MCEFTVKIILISLISTDILGEQDVISATRSNRTKREPPTNFLPPKPQYGPRKSQYGPSTQQYRPPKPQYGPPTPQYGTPTSQYGAPKPQYGPPKPQYGSPQPQSGFPKPQYGSPKPLYGPSSTQYGVPQNQYGPPSTQYGVPQNQYGPPQIQSGVPQTQYGVPQNQYGPPSNQYGSPPNQYGSPRPQFGLSQNQYQQFYDLSNIEAPKLIYKQPMLYGFSRSYFHQVPLLSTYFNELPFSMYGYQSIFPLTMPPSLRYSELQSRTTSEELHGVSFGDSNEDSKPIRFRAVPAALAAPPNFSYSSAKYYDSFGCPSYYHEEDQSHLNYGGSSSSYDTPGAVTSYGTPAVNHRNPARYQNDVDVENAFSNVSVKFAAKPNMTAEVKTTSINKSSPH